jgi:hypothetical protein
LLVCFQHVTTIRQLLQILAEALSYLDVCLLAKGVVMRLRFAALMSVVWLLCLGVIPAFGISIDTFDGDQSAFPVSSAPFKSSVLQTNSAIGGYRELDSKLTSGSFLATVVGAGFLSHSQGDSSKGSTQIVWDGNSDNSSLDPTGLGGVDFTQDGGTAIDIFVRSFDFPFSKPVSMQLDIYDSSDASGGKFSRTVLTLNQQITNTTFALPFANFTAQGVNGGVNFHHVGAVVLNILGVNEAVDLSIDLIGTNGHCDLVPMPGGVIVDQCGVCGGDNSSCKDCAGIPNGPNVAGASCQANNPGFCGPGNYDLSCKCVQHILPDTCGICFGDNTSCLTCNQSDQSLIHFHMDGAAKAQERIIDHALTILGRAAPDKNTAKYIAKVRARAHTLQIRNWTLSWQLPNLAVVCGDSPLCLKISNMDKVNEYRQHNVELRNLAHEVNAKILKVSKTKNVIKDVKLNLTQADNKFSYALNLTYQVPTDQSVCSVPVS